MLRTKVLRQALGALMIISATGVTAPVQAQWLPNETQVSSNAGLIDYEFSQSRAKLAWTDTRGALWLADVDRNTGNFVPADGRGLQIASSTVHDWNMFMWNGPEWIATASGEHIFYSFYVEGKVPLAINTRMAIAAPDQNGNWVTQALQPNVPRMSHIASKNGGDPNPTIKYLDPRLNQYWRNLLDPQSEQRLDFLPPSTKSWRFAEGVRALLYTSVVDGTAQVFRYLLDSATHEQLTFDAGGKDLDRSVPWMWQAPELGNDFVFSTIVERREIRVYRQFAGRSDWILIYSAMLPEGRSVGSPEFFTYRNRSYLFMVAYVDGAEYPSEIWVSNILPNQQVFRRVNDDSLLRARNDPEVFVTIDHGPLIYYNRYDPSIKPGNPLCRECSEGVFRADPGLKNEG